MQVSSRVRREFPLSFSSLAQTEKTEHLIYSILPISLATFVASFLVTNDPLTILAAVISISSFGSLLLFEFTPEKPLIDGVLRWRARSRKSLRDALLVFSLMLKTWRSEVIGVTEEKDHIEDLARSQVSLVVAGPYIGKKTWRIRASVYLFLSVPFLFRALWNYIDRVMIDSPVVFRDLPQWVLRVLGALYEFLDGVVLTFLLLILTTGLIRHWSLTSHIDHLARYDYLVRTLSVQRLQYPEYFSESKSFEGEKDEIGLLRIPYDTLVAEIEPLRNLLEAEDWSAFLNGWDRLYQWVCRQAARQGSEHWAYYLLKPVADVNRACREENRGEPVFVDDIVHGAQEEIRRVCYFLNKVVEYQEAGATVELPRFDADLFRVLKDVCSWSLAPEKLKDTTAILQLAEKFPVIRNRGIATALMWALSWLEADNHSWGGLGGVKYLITLANDEEEPAETREMAADIALRAFEEGGAGFGWGYFFEVEDLLVLKDLAPPERRGAWYGALAHFIDNAKDRVADVLDDDRLKQAVQESVVVERAVARYRSKFLVLDERKAE